MSVLYSSLLIIVFLSVLTLNTGCTKFKESDQTPVESLDTSIPVSGTPNNGSNPSGSNPADGGANNGTPNTGTPNSGSNPSGSNPADGGANNGTPNTGTPNNGGNPSGSNPTNGNVEPPSNIPVIGKLNLFIEQSSFNPLIAKETYVSIKNNETIDLGKTSAGQSTSFINLKIYNDKSEKTILSTPSITGGLSLIFDGVSFPLTIDSKKSIVLRMAFNSSSPGIKKGEMIFGSNNEMKINFSLTVK